jgi:hypothetical protein
MMKTMTTGEMEKMETIMKVKKNTEEYKKAKKENESRGFPLLASYSSLISYDAFAILLCSLYKHRRLRRPIHNCKSLHRLD